VRGEKDTRDGSSPGACILNVLGGIPYRSAMQAHLPSRPAAARTASDAPL